MMNIGNNGTVFVMSSYEKKYHNVYIPDTLFQLISNPFDVVVLEGMSEDNILILKYPNRATTEEVKKSVDFNGNHENFVKVNFHERFVTLTFTNKIWLVRFKVLLESYKANLSNIDL